MVWSVSTPIMTPTTMIVVVMRMLNQPESRTTFALAACLMVHTRAGSYNGEIQRTEATHKELPQEEDASVSIVCLLTRGTSAATAEPRASCVSAGAAAGGRERQQMEGYTGMALKAYRGMAA